jgi:anti-anti-sigma factor
MEAAVEIGERREGDVLVLRPVGRIDNLTSAEFQARLLGAATSGSDDILVDLAAVDYISSAGLRALMVASRNKPKELRLAVASLNEVVQEIFAISRFSQVVPIFATVEEALAAWEAAPRAREAVAAAETAPLEPLRVHFWGTRGSLPAPLRESAVRAKIYDALAAAQGHALDTPEAINAFIDRRLPFSVRGTFGGNTSCVEIITGGEE